jgi:hypothetical protein
MSTNKVFIDSRVNDIAFLVSQFVHGTEFQVLDVDKDGIEQIISDLSGQRSYDSIQIISHGAPGSIIIGSTVLDSSTLGFYAAELALIGGAMSEHGDLLLYGCNVAAGEKGRQFIETLAQMTGADVAASDDLTGGTAAGGDWVLEAQTGVIEMSGLTDESFSLFGDVLAVPTLTAFIAVVAVTSEDTLVEITFVDLKVQGDESDVDGTVDAFVVKSVSSGRLKIGADAVTATLFDGWKNNTIDATHHAYWSPATNVNGTLNAFAVVARDNLGTESLAAIQATVRVNGEHDAPTMYQPFTLSFGATVDYATGGSPVSVISADVNGDANTDLVVVNQYSDTVSVLTNNDDGTFAVKEDYATGNYPVAVRSLDVNGDHKPDLVVANYFDDTLSVLLNNGNGTFAAKVDYSTGGSAWSVTNADLNGDGNQDLVVVNRWSAVLSVLLNNGDGTFAAKVDYDTGSYPYSMASADVNGDGKLDLVFVNSDSNTLSVLKNNGDGTFAAKVDYATGSTPLSVSSTDVNGDWKPDMVVVNHWSDTLSVFKNNGDGTFAAKVDYATGSLPWSVTSADMNGDGTQDLVVVNYSNNTFSILKNNGDGTFAAKEDFSTGSLPWPLTNADVNGDGKQDLVFVNTADKVSVLKNTSQVTATNFIEQTPVQVSSGIVINHPDGDASWNGGELKFQITANAETADSLSLATVNPGGSGIWLNTAAGNMLMAGATVIGIANAASVSSGGAWSFIFNGHATNALVQDVARAVTFSNSSDMPGIADRSIRFTAVDNLNASASIEHTVTVTAVNDVPTLTAFSAAVAVTSEDTVVEITLGYLKVQGDESDIDGTVDAFVVTSVSSGSLKIGGDAVTATPFDGWKNNTIDATHHAYWSPATNVNGMLNALAVVARDNLGTESLAAIQAMVRVNGVSDAPIMYQPLTLSFGATVDYATGNSPVSVIGAEMNGDGHPDLVVANAGSYTLSVLKNNGDGTFAAKVDCDTGSSPSPVISADFNGDGNQDLVFANHWSDTLSVLKNNGDGTFAAKEDYLTGSSPWSVTSADINGDGHQDLVAANAGNNTLSVLLNNGDGTFAAKEDYATGSSSYSVTSADVNGDGKPDLIAANFYSNTLSVLLNNGDGTFAVNVDYAIGSWSWSVTSADVNGDGKLDLVAANSGNNTLSVLLNNGDGTFAAQEEYATGSSPWSVTSADVNGDGNPDLVVAHTGNNTLSVLLNNGDGTFAPKEDYAIGSRPYSVMSADVDGDGKSDLVTANYWSENVSVLKNTSQVTAINFIEQTPVRVSSGIVLNHPDGDGSWSGGVLKFQITGNPEIADSLSLATVNPGDSGIWLNTAAENMLMAGSTDIGTADAALVNSGGAWSFSFNGNATNALVQDVARAVTFSNNSDTPDPLDRSVTITATDKVGSSVAILQPLTVQVVNDAPILTAFSAPVYETNEDTAVQITFSELNANVAVSDVDGSVDAVFVVKEVSSGSLKIGSDAASATPYTWGANNIIDAMHHAYWTPALNANGKLNAFTLVARDNGGTLSFEALQAMVNVATENDAPVMYLPFLSLSFADRVDYSSGSAYSVTSVDVNGDGKQHLVIANYSSDTVSVLRSNGDGTFAASVDYPTGNLPHSVISADVNSDGKLDLVVGNVGSQSVSVLLNNGDGTFAGKVDYVAGGNAVSIVSADVNGDGNPDLVVANEGYHTVSVLVNNGDGTFADHVDYATSFAPWSVSGADVNGDGKADLVIANQNSNTVSVLLNNGDGTFAGKVDYPTGERPSSVTSVDVNDDGKSDLVVANQLSDTLSVLTNNGDGTFVDKVDYTTGWAPWSLISEDINGDRKPDLVVTNQGSDTVSVLVNNGDGTFADKIDFATDKVPYSVASTDVNGDGKVDLIVANQGSDKVSVLINSSQSAVSFTEQTPVHVSSGLVINDPDGDASWNGGSLKLQIIANAEAGDSLSIATVNPGGSGIWLDIAAGNKLMAGSTAIGAADASFVSNGVAWNLTFNENATNALVQDVACAVTFNNSSETPSVVDRRISVTATDGSHASVSKTFDLIVAGEDLPFNDMTGSVTFWKSGLAMTEVTTTLASTTATDSMSTGIDGLYQHLDMVAGTYALTGVKVSGSAGSNAVKANDALAALKIAVGMNPNADGSDVSPYQFLAADVNKDGQVKAADALNILKMAVKLSTAPEKEWLFVQESVGSESMSRTHVVWPDNPIPLTLVGDQELDLIGIVKGDVNGSWLP